MEKERNMSDAPESIWRAVAIHGNDTTAAYYESDMYIAGQVEYIRKDIATKNIRAVFEKFGHEYRINREDTIPPDRVVIEIWNAVKADLGEK